MKEQQFTPGRDVVIPLETEINATPITGEVTQNRDFAREHHGMFCGSSKRL